MALPHGFRVMAAALLLILAPLSGSGGNGLASEQDYTPRSQDEVELLSVVVAAEMKANSWPKSELVCISINGQDPSSKLVKALRRLNLNVCRSSDFSKKFNCDFELQLEFSLVEPLKNVDVRSKTLDLRQIKNRQADIATLLKDGEYLLHKVDGKWSVREYIAKLL
jgi:hypothetical protein